MKKGTVGLVVTSVGVTLLVTNYLTDGAVFEAIGSCAVNTKDVIADKIFPAATEAAEKTTEAAEAVVDVATEIA